MGVTFKQCAKHFSGVLAVSAVFLSIFATTASAKKLVPVDSDPSPGTGLSVTVRNEKTVLAGARVWVETLDGKLLAEGVTSTDGRFSGEVPDAALAAGVAVTAYAANHSAVSFLENVAHRVTLELPMAPLDSYSIMTGKLTGFKETDDESKAMVGLVAKAMEVTDLVQLDASSFISPLKDTIDVFGRREIPSNIVLPDQTFPVYFIPVRVNKPIYRLPVLSGTSSRYFGVSGTVAVQDAINAIRGGNGWDIVNLLEFNKVGVTPAVPVTTGGKTIKVDVVSDTPIRDVMKLRPGRNTTSGESKRLAVALWEPLPGMFVPTDVKLVQNEDVALTAVENKSAKIMDVVVDSNGSHFRGAWLKSASTSMPDVGLTAEVNFTTIDSTWMIRGGETAQLVIAHVEDYKETSIGSHRYEDRWVLVGPRKTQLRLPAVAYHALQTLLGKISHVSVDLLQLGHGGYPFLEGENSSSELSVIEKVRKEVH